MREDSVPGQTASRVLLPFADPGHEHVGRRSSREVDQLGAEVLLEGAPGARRPYCELVTGAVRNVANRDLGDACSRKQQNTSVCYGDPDSPGRVAPGLPSPESYFVWPFALPFPFAPGSAGVASSAWPFAFPFGAGPAADVSLPARPGGPQCV